MRLPHDTLYVLNARNGLAFASTFPTEHISMFLSSHAHHAGSYFRCDAMPYAATIHLLNGGTVCVLDASTHKAFPDSLVTGLGSWVIAFNRAIGIPCDPYHATSAMRRFAWYSDDARRVVRSVRKLMTVYRNRGAARMHFVNPAVTGFSYNSKWVPCSIPECGPSVVACSPERATWDDKPELVRRFCGRVDCGDQVRCV